jgi:hypothetical protein
MRGFTALGLRISFIPAPIEACRLRTCGAPHLSCFQRRELISLQRIPIRAQSGIPYPSLVDSFQASAIASGFIFGLPLLLKFTQRHSNQVSGKLIIDWL